MNIIVSSKFRPFTYDELMRPRKDYTEAYEKVEQQYQELSDLTDFWRQIVGQEGENSQVYQTYNAYDKALASIVDDFSKGMNPRNRRQLGEMRRRFHGEIKPIETAYNVRQKQIEALHEGRLKGVVYENDAATTSLDEYIKNPQLLYSGVDSTAGFNRLASVATALSKGIVTANATGKLDAYTKAFMQKYGYNVEDVQSGIALVMSDLNGIKTGEVSSNGARMVQDLLANEVQAAGIADWNVGARREYISKVAPALYQAVGAMQISPMEDYGAREGLRHSNSVALENLRHQNSISEIQERAKNTTTSSSGTGSSSGSSSSSGGGSEYVGKNVRFTSKGKVEELGTSDKAKGVPVRLEKKSGTLKNKSTYDVLVSNSSGTVIGWVNTLTGDVWYSSSDTSELLKGKGREASMAEAARQFLYNPGEAKQYNYYVDTDADAVYRTSNTAHKQVGNGGAGTNSAVDDLMRELTER